MRKSFLLILFQLVVFGVLYSQQFGGNPPSLKWRQLNTDTARIIYPVGLDSQAQRVANIVHYLAHEKVFSPGDQLRKINIVLQNQTTIANGYVGLGPYRSEFQMTPSPDNFDQGSLPWTDQLAVHEYRHVMQFNNFRNGLSKAFYYLFGEDGYLIAVDAAIPDWFFEGDAVYNETFVTRQGRGRLPLFMNSFPALWEAGRHYSFMKLRNGSLKDYVPDHYNLGYLLVNYGREKYGLDFWNKVTHDASAFRGLFYPFQQAVKRYAGIDYKDFYRNAFEYYKKALAVTEQNGKEPIISAVSRRYVTNYLFPYQIGQDSLLYLKTSYRKIPAFIIKDSQGEHRLRARDISDDLQFSYRGGYIVYAAYEHDARWAWKDYSVIKLINIRTGEERRITKRSKYFSPDISADGKKIVVVKNGTDGKSEIHILEAENGKVVQRIKAPGRDVFTDPKFVNAANLVSFVRQGDGTMALYSIELNGGEIERLSPPGYQVAGYPCVAEGWVYFTASYSGNDDVYALRLADRKIFQLTHDHLGNYYVNVQGGKAIVSRFTAQGYQLREIAIAPGMMKEVDVSMGEGTVGRFRNEGKTLQQDVLLEKTPGRQFESGIYKQNTRLFNFHSWRPYYEDPDFTYSLYGENVLNSLQTSVYYHYNQNEKTNGVGVSAVYGALFPFITIGTEYTFNRSDTVKSKTISWSQLDTKLGLSVPLNFSNGRTYKYLTIGTNYVLRNEFFKGLSRASYHDVNFSYLHHFISWQQTIQSARQQILPRLGYVLAVNHRYAIGNYSGYQFIGQASVYLPGFLTTHNIVLSAAFQQRDTSATLFSNAFAGARGYTDYYYSRMWKLGANYHLPLFYPDWGFGGILYVQRVRANLFYDFSRVYSNDKLRSRDLRSVGAEVYLDTRWWNEYPLSFGLRYSRLLDSFGSDVKGSNVLELILPVSIIPR